MTRGGSGSAPKIGSAGTGRLVWACSEGSAAARAAGGSEDPRACGAGLTGAGSEKLPGSGRAEGSPGAGSARKVRMGGSGGFMRR